MMEGQTFTPLSQPEKEGMNDLQSWLTTGGAKFDSLSVVNFKGYRGVASMRAI
jgi:hypothetical protein